MENINVDWPEIGTLETFYIDEKNIELNHLNQENEDSDVTLKDLDMNFSEFLKLTNFNDSDELMRKSLKKQRLNIHGKTRQKKKIIHKLVRIKREAKTIYPIVMPSGFSDFFVSVQTKT